MADVTIEAAASANSEHRSDRSGPVWTSDTVGYVFFINSAETLVQYRKTTNSGTSWGAATTILTMTGGGGAKKLTIWFDKWTPGDSGTKVHVFGYSWDSDLWRYRSLDTASDTLGTEVSVTSAAGDASADGNWSAQVSSCVKAVGGNLYLAYQNGAAGGWHRSTDGGANWGSRTTPFETSVRDAVLALPANTSDNQDAALIFWDVSADELSVKMYDDSANTWTETSISTGIVESAARDYLQMAGSVRHSDSHLIVAAWNAFDTGTADLKCWDLTVDSISTPTVTAKTDVISNTSEAAQCAVQVNQNTNDLYVAYLKGSSFASDVHAVYKKSTDGGTSWGSETTLSVTNDNHKLISTDLSTKSGSSGRFEPVWFNDDLGDVVTNVDNSVAITAGGGGATLRRYSLPLTGVG